MIPKIIHFCWFGNNKLPDTLKTYIKSWKLKCPNYKIICWSENNFNVNKYPFTKAAYKYKDWAAISDYVRLLVLKKYGGIYLDTDVEILKSLNPLLENTSFIGMEDKGVIASGLIYGAKPNDFNVSNLLNIYNNIDINNNNESVGKRFNSQVHITTRYFHQRGFRLNNKKQKVNGCIIYPTEYFCPQKYGSSEINLTNHTYTIHHYYGSWTKNMTQKQKNHIAESRLIKKIIGVHLYNYLYNIYKEIKNK